MNDAAQHTVPSDRDSTPANQAPAQGSSCCLGVVITGLAVLILLGLLSPMIGQPREAGRAAQCDANLHTIGRAMHAYHQKHGCFPPAYIADQSGEPEHSWRVLLLPFLGENALYKEYRFDEPWNGPHNSQLAARIPPVYRCPSYAKTFGREATNSLACYAMIVGPHAFSDGPTPRKANDIKDDPATTIIVAESVWAGINWLEPRDLDVAKMTFQITYPTTNDHGPLPDISTCHPNAAHVLLLDQSTRRLSQEVDPDTLRALMTIDGGEAVKRDCLD